MRVFEETFGIDKLQNLVTKIGDKFYEGNYNQEEGKYLLTDDDLKKTMQVLDEFKTRHATITQSIEETYRIGNRLLDFLEKQIIIDYHLRGDQEKLLAEFPHLTDKAKKFLGFELFFELSVQPDGIPLSNVDPKYQDLMKKQKMIQESIENEYLRHKYERDDNPNLPKYQDEDSNKEEKSELPPSTESDEEKIIL